MKCIKKSYLLIFLFLLSLLCVLSTFRVNALTVQTLKNEKTINFTSHTQELDIIQYNSLLNYNRTMQINDENYFYWYNNNATVRYSEYTKFFWDNPAILDYSVDAWTLILLPNDNLTGFFYDLPSSIDKSDFSLTIGFEEADLSGNFKKPEQFQLRIGDCIILNFIPSGMNYNIHNYYNGANNLITTLNLDYYNSLTIHCDLALNLSRVQFFNNWNLTFTTNYSVYNNFQYKSVGFDQIRLYFQIIENTAQSSAIMIHSIDWSERNGYFPLRVYLETSLNSYEFEYLEYTYTQYIQHPDYIFLEINITQINCSIHSNNTKISIFNCYIYDKILDQFVSISYLSLQNNLTLSTNYYTNVSIRLRFEVFFTFKTSYEWNSTLFIKYSIGDELPFSWEMMQTSFILMLSTILITIIPSLSIALIFKSDRFAKFNENINVKYIFLLFYLMLVIIVFLTFELPFFLLALNLIIMVILFLHTYNSKGEI